MCAYQFVSIALNYCYTNSKGKNMDNNIAAIGKRIQKCRENAGLTQQKVAEYMDWSTNFVSRLERGCTMTSVCKLCKLANVLDTTVSAFFY